MRSPMNDPKLETLLARLHSESDAQNGAMDAYFKRRHKDGTLGDMTTVDDDMHAFFVDKMVALEPDKAEYCYLMCRALQARRVVEIGTSFGVSTLYLAAAVRDNGHPDSVVIGTELEPAKAVRAEEHFTEAGLSGYIDLRVGDLRDTLSTLEGPIDFVLMDIWNVARPALELVVPHLRRGAVVVADNTASFAASYADFFEFVRDPANGLRSVTMPYVGGLEFIVQT